MLSETFGAYNFCQAVGIIKKTKQFISSHQELLLKDYLTKFLKEYDKTCSYFYNFYEELFYDLQLYNFSHNPFELTIWFKVVILLACLVTDKCLL